MTADALTGLIAEHGLLILGLLCIVEGPAATLAGAWLASLGLLPLGGVLVVAVLGEIAGDLLHYLAGRLILPRLSPVWRARLGLTDQRVARLDGYFRRHGASTLVLGKFTHALGAAVLLAAGAARMNILTFLGWTVASGVPKVLLLTALGWQLGLADLAFGAGTWAVAVAVAALALAALVATNLRRSRGMRT